MVKVINNLGKLYELRVVAEGVETKSQLEYLQDIGCDWMQGYFLSYPLKKAELIEFLSQNKAKSYLVSSHAVLS